jgi:hypothetical protein
MAYLLCTGYRKRAVLATGIKRRQFHRRITSSQAQY